jgi:CzcA family heavy metal efflux pump
MTIVAAAHRHRRAVLLATAFLAGAGLLSGLTLPSDIYPPLHFPRVVIIVHSGTLPTSTMTIAVTRPLEQAAMETPGVRRVRSRTFRGAAEISVQFTPETDMVVALQQVQGRAAELRPELPGGTELIIERLTTAAFPILSLNLSGGLPIAELRDYAFYVLRPALARAPGVGRVEVLSSDEREIEVVADPTRLRAAGIGIDQLADALRAENVMAPVGRYSSSGQQRLALASGQWRSIADIGQTPVVVRNNAVVRVSDLAQVFPGAPDRTSLVTGNGRDAVAVSVSKQPEANIIAVRTGVEAALAEATRTLPSGLHLVKTYDLAEFVSSSIANVRDAILIGGVLAVLVLFLFLRDWRITLAATVALPITAAVTFLVMRLAGQSINVMSMGGLAVAIGLVIDDAVVVVENIHRRAHDGSDAAAVRAATEEMVAPIVGSTLTTVVVFAPLGLLSGVVGDFFRALSITLSAAVLISLALALMLIPLVARGLARRQPRPDRARGPGLEEWYSRALQRVLYRPVAVIGAVIVIVAAAAVLYTRIGSGFLPQMDEGGFIIDYQTPPGTAIEETDRQIRRAEAILSATPEVASYSRRTGTELGLFATMPSKGDILVRLKPRGQRAHSADEIISAMRPKLEDALPGVEIEFVQLLQDVLGDLEGTPTPIEVKFFGDDPDVLAQLAGQGGQILSGVRGVVDIFTEQPGNPEDEWEIDAAAAGRLGLTVEQVSAQLATAWLGSVPTELRLLDRTIPVRVRYPDADRFNPAVMGAILIRGANGQTAPLSNLARVKPSNGQSVALRENLREMALVTARLEGRDLGSAVSELETQLTHLTLPVGYSYEIGGQFASQRRAFRELLAVFGIAVALVLLVLVVEFRQWAPALLILAAAPLASAGAFALLLVTGVELNVSSAMGLILLVGLVVKNGIVLLDHAQRLRADHVPLDRALVVAGGVRIRPILMTTLCTLLGLLPLALGLGSGAELQKPLALAVIGGLSLSTAVTLFVLPTLYLAISGRRNPA